MGGAYFGVLLILLGIALLWLSQRAGGGAAARSASSDEGPVRARPPLQIMVERELSWPLRKPLAERSTNSPAVPVHQPATLPQNFNPGDDVSGNGGSIVSRTASVPLGPQHHFMAWLQSGLADQSIRFNESGAVVHFVEEGMLLVSPNSFKAYARSRNAACKALDEKEGDDGADTARWIQRKVLKAGWHLRSADGSNFREYRMSRGGSGASRLCGVLILDPARFVSPVPPVNTSLSPGKAIVGECA